CSSRRAAGKRPPKRLKSERPAPVKAELEGPTGGGESLASLEDALKPSVGDQRSGGDCSLMRSEEDCTLIQQEEVESIAEPNKDNQQKEQDVPPEPHAVKSGSALPQLGTDEHLHIYSEEERSCQSLLSDESSVVDADVPRKLMELDRSALLNEDSNQPMPVARFFGDLELLRDLPAAALPSTMMSRREFRKLHIIAKEEEEEEEEEDVV
ncbi:CA174 protein, partial [Tricholaema leucomelas]|nr:CA174 protein [Tricholaema leucomelas]